MVTIVERVSTFIPTTDPSEGFAGYLVEPESLAHTVLSIVGDAADWDMETPPDRAENLCELLSTIKDAIQDGSEEKRLLALKHD